MSLINKRVLRQDVRSAQCTDDVCWIEIRGILETINEIVSAQAVAIGDSVVQSREKFLEVLARGLAVKNETVGGGSRKVLR